MKNQEPFIAQKEFEYRTWDGITLLSATESDLRLDLLGQWASIAYVGDKTKPHPKMDNGDGYWIRVK